MQIATWNVNSIRTRLGQVKNWIKDNQPDLLCLQETKVEDEHFPKRDLEDIGYKVTVHGQKSYNGVALISRKPLQDIRLGLTGELIQDPLAKELSKQKRVISALADGIRVVNIYVPNGSAIKSEKYEYKLQWLKCLHNYINAQAKREEPLCILGDFNIALEDRDIHNPENLTGKIMASKKERDALLYALGNDMEDVFRIFEPESSHWSWWDYRSGAWDRDRGWRIDHIYLCSELLRQAKSCVIHKETRGLERPSDHAPVVVDINWPPNEEDNDDSNSFYY